MNRIIDHKIRSLFTDVNVSKSQGRSMNTALQKVDKSIYNKQYALAAYFDMKVPSNESECMDV